MRSQVHPSLLPTSTPSSLQGTVSLTFFQQTFKYTSANSAQSFSKRGLSVSFLLGRLMSFSSYATASVLSLGHYGFRGGASLQIENAQLKLHFSSCMLVLSFELSLIHISEPTRRA